MRSEKKSVKDMLSDNMVKLGKRGVQKSILLMLYEPKVPEKLKDLRK